MIQESGSVTRRLIAVIGGMVLYFNTVQAQVIFPGDYTRDYYRILLLKDTTLVDPITLNPSIISAYALSDSLQWDLWDGRFRLAPPEDQKKFYVLNPTFDVSYNTASNKGFNDGAVWKGKGLNSSVNFGVTGTLGKIRYTIAPVVYYAQNKHFNIPSGPSQAEGRSPYAYPFAPNIDWPQRFGDGSVAEIHPGQSEIRFIHGKFTIGVSTENMIWGPAQINPIIMSTNAGGFPHLDIGTLVPVQTKIGKVEFRTFWGQLNESEYFDADPDNQTRYISGFTLGYQPKYIKGMSLGINRILYTDWSGGNLSAGDFFIPFRNFFINNADSTGFSLTNDSYDQMMSGSLRWEFPKSGLDAYIEYAYNDFPGSFLDLMEQPDRTRALAFGFIKVFDLTRDRLFKITYEHTSVSKSRVATTFPHPSYYVHEIIKHGYTERGQLIGASIGPGSNMDYLALGYYTPNGRIIAHFRRIRFNDDYLFANFAFPNDIPTDYEVNLGLNYLRFTNNFSINPYFVWSYKNNWFFDDSVETENWQFGFRLGYFVNR